MGRPKLGALILSDVLGVMWWWDASRIYVVGYEMG